MKIKGINVHVPFAVWIVFGFFVVLFVALFFGSGCKIPAILYWGIPLAGLMLLLALMSNYSLATQYYKLLPEYEEKAVPARIKNLTISMQGKGVRVEGVVQKVSCIILGRPRLTIFDGSGACTVFRSIPLDEKIVVGDNIEAVGMVVRKYLIAGTLSVHGVGIRKRENGDALPLDYAEPDEDPSAQKPTIRIKKYN